MGTHELKTPASKITVPDDLIRLSAPLFGGKQGSFVKVRKAGEGEKTKLGLYLGDLPLGVAGGVTATGELVLKYGMTNPAIFVFEDNQIVYGCESWWGQIETPEELKEITDGDIGNVWYVRALKALTTEEKRVEA